MEAVPAPSPAGFSSPKRATLLFLKRSPDATLASIAGALRISRTAALRHLANLEESGLVERSYRRGGRGRPPACFRLTPPSRRLFPEAYTQLSLSALGFIEKTQGRSEVVRMLEERAQDLRRAHSPRLEGKALAMRARELTSIRDQEGYMASLKRPADGVYELVEHNCPILAIAERYGEACDVERRLFHDLLDAEVTVSHRVVAGDSVCRFLLRRNRSQTP